MVILMRDKRKRLQGYCNRSKLSGDCGNRCLSYHQEMIVEETKPKNYLKTFQSHFSSW